MNYNQTMSAKMADAATKQMAMESYCFGNLMSAGYCHHLEESYYFD